MSTDKPETEFDEWAKRFEAQPHGEYSHGKYKEWIDPPQCMYPLREGPHKVAHLAVARYRSLDSYPVCRQHAHLEVRPAWREYVEGA